MSLALFDAKVLHIDSFSTIDMSRLLNNNKYGWSMGSRNSTDAVSEAVAGLASTQNLRLMVSRSFTTYSSASALSIILTTTLPKKP